MTRIKLSEPSSPPTLPFRTVADPVRQFAEFEQLLVANSGEDAFDVAVKLVAAKIEDELQARDQGSPRRFMTGADARSNFERAEALLRDAAARWTGIIEFNGGLGLSAEQLARCTRCLVGWDILDTSFHHLDAMLERLVARGSKGALGQYFTPRSVIEMCVVAVNPRPSDSVIDPACGSGGFLLEALDHGREGGTPTGPRCLGIDYSAKSLKVASLLAVAAGRELIRVDKGNSIDGREYSGRDEPVAWDGFLRPSGGRAPWGAWGRLSASVVLTNPPFAGDIDESAILDAYDSQRAASRGRRSSVSREHLFLERAVQLLRPGGRLAIVLPQGLLANSSASYLRQWLFREVRVLAVVGLHPHTFFPHTGVKTSVLFAVKETPPANYGVLFATSRDPGKDSRGKVTGTGDYHEIGSLIHGFARSEGYPWATGAYLEGFERFVVPVGEVVAADRLDAEFFDADKREVYTRATQLDVGSLAARTVRVSGRFRKRDLDEIDYVDIGSVDARTGLSVPTRMVAEEAPSRAASILQRGDVLVSTVRPDRNVVAFVNQDPDAVTVASSGFCVLRPAPSVSPELLFVFCKSNFFRDVVSRHATASMYPTVTDADVMRVPALLPDGGVAEAITEKVQSALNRIEQARKELSEAITAMNEFHQIKLSEEPSRAEPVSSSSAADRRGGKPHPGRSSKRRSGDRGSEGSG